MANNSNWMPRSAFLELNRKHVAGPFWERDAGTDFWMVPAGVTAAEAASTATIEQLVEGGWVATSLVETVGSGADFMSADDKGIPNHILTDASSDLLHSPAIFGDYVHAKMAQDISGMGKLPTDLILECHASFTVSSNDDQGTGFGFLESAGSIITENDHLGVITSDGTNFQLAANGGAGALTDAGAVDGTAWSFWKIRINLADQLIYWYIDETLQGSIAVTADQFPCRFGMGVEASSTGNRVGLGIVHIYYDW